MLFSIFVCRVRSRKRNTRDYDESEEEAEESEEDRTEEYTDGSVEEYSASSHSEDEGHQKSQRPRYAGE
jgi:hypothetical protein